MGRDARPKKSLGASLHSRIKESRVLMVGAGGIGCELLKNLVLTGFGEIHLVDLDTIDLSNLNRQFLFGMQHIKKSKAIVARETAGKFNPNVKLEAHHANIKDPQFNVKWFKGFDLVFNALDNLDARKHVNRMCLAAYVPLIESGTTGYHGQVQVIKQGETECYDCNPKQVPKSFPVCTIRSTPSQPIHCIVWAKSYLFAEVFGTSEDSSTELDQGQNEENAQEIANLRREASELNSIREKMDSPDFAKCIFEKVFGRDIDRLLSMEDMWKSRKPPTPLDHAKVLEEASGIGPEVAREDQKTWCLAENYAVFADSVKRLSQRMLELKAKAKEGDAPPILSFDKDDEDTLDFVAAGANLRSHAFGIELKSKFDIKQMAGNIIPAIATTNAITAGLCVLQAFKVLRNDLQSGKMVFLAKNSDRAFNAEKLAPPNPECQVCGVARVSVEANIAVATLGDLIEKVVRTELGYGEDISVLTSQLLYDIDYDDNLDTPLKELGFEDETFVTIVDEEEGEGVVPRANLEIVVTHSEELADETITVPEKIEIPRKPKRSTAPEETTGEAIKHALEDNEDGGVAKKRKLNDGLTFIEDRPNKKRAVVPDADADLIVLEDDGAITID
ncbi:ubiquitin-activating enzyme E1 3 [Sphaerosporella brunnea]|uniref:Ubiquitin-activating enzyme E1-like n=1 Tax=Sphaerosporella brunnea TaxID=1250544 RepID=A0A5J5EIW0_9PEZI|nr:ubiquitin-activating enzyme E1 3 [Sphaerosporella brunnea]